MKLPSNNNLVISDEKLLDYILSETHSIGRFKARYFKAFGFDEDNIELFRNALQEVAQSFDITNRIETEYGIKYVIDGDIATPLGNDIRIRTVWFIEKKQNKPRFVTVYPV